MDTRHAWSFVAVLLLTLQHNVDPAVAILSLDIADLCPYSNFCTSTPNRTIADPDLQACCLPCSCQSDCGIIGKCCPGAEQSSATTEEYPCRRPLDIYKSYLNITQSWKTIGNHNFRIIDGCPVEALHVADLTENVFRCHNALELEDLVFVTGTVSGYTYLNKHCAICNNDTVYTDWKLYITKRSLLSPGMSFEERDKGILNNGGVESVPPTHEIALKALCTTSQKDRCNLTGQWDVFDREMEMKCNTVTVEYFQDYWSGRWNFANVYCYLCNQPTGTIAPSVCEKISTTQIEDTRAYGMTFSALLLLRKPDVEETSSCPAGDILDPYRMSCTQLFCPVGTVAQKGSCVDMIDEEVGFDLRVVVEVLFVDRVDVISIDHDAFYKGIARLFMKRINIGKVTCKMCTLVTYLDKSDGAVYVVTTLQTTKTCSRFDLIRGLSTLFKNISVNVNLQNTKVVLTLLDREQGHIILVKPLEYRSTIVNTEYCSGLYVFTLGDVYCPSVHITSKDMNDFGAFGNVQTLIKAKSVELQNGTMQLCFDDYISILKKTQLISGNQKHRATNIIVYMGVMLTVSMNRNRGVAYLLHFVQ